MLLSMTRVFWLEHRSERDRLRTVRREFDEDRARICELFRRRGERFFGDRRAINLRDRADDRQISLLEGWRAVERLILLADRERQTQWIVVPGLVPRRQIDPASVADEAAFELPTRG